MSYQKKSYWWVILWLIIAAIVFVGDYFTKQWAINSLTKANTTVVSTNGIINWAYTENTGMAWSFLNNNTTLITVLSGVGIAIALVVLIICCERKILSIGLAMVIGGGLGNFIERIRLHHVTDFIQFGFWRSFPVFNIADAAITIGTLFIIIYIVFHKEIENTADVNGSV